MPDGGACARSRVSDTGHEMRLLDSAESAEKLEIEVCGGTVFAYTCRAPDKESDNEDCVAVMPYGPGAAVLAIADGAPSDALFVADGLHLNARGYALWTKILKPVLERETPEPELR